MNAKRKILILIDWYLPGFRAGGPIQSCANLIERLKEEYEFSVITTDRDLGDVKPYSNIKPDQWNIIGNGTRVYYFSKKKMTLGNLKKLLLNEDFGTIYLNSLFSKYFTIYPLLIIKYIKPQVKIILAPRGMLGRGALDIKPLKKKIFLVFSKIVGLYKHIVWHASTVLESKEIKNEFGANAVVITALNLPSINKMERVKRIKEEGKLNLVFFSRISPKKNLHLAIHLLSLLEKNLGVNFDIYGLNEDAGYWAACEQEIKKLDSNKKVRYKGVIEHTMIPQALNKYHFSILPTTHENYGHSIVESFTAGCPVIISDQTPWRNLKTKKAGWDITLDNKQKFVDALKQATMMQQSEFDSWSKNAYDLAESILLNDDAIQQNRQLFLK